MTDEKEERSFVAPAVVGDTVDYTLPEGISIGGKYTFKAEIIALDNATGNATLKFMPPLAESEPVIHENVEYGAGAGQWYEIIPDDVAEQWYESIPDDVADHENESPSASTDNPGGGEDVGAGEPAEDPPASDDPAHDGPALTENATSGENDLFDEKPNEDLTKPPGVE